MIEYSLGLVAGYAGAKWATPRFPSLKGRKFHLHHWMWSLIVLFVVFWKGWDFDWLVGLLTGISLQGLSYKNWSIFRAD